jgi:hypothetical protein
MSAKPTREGAGNVLHYDSDGVRTRTARRGRMTWVETPAISSATQAAIANATSTRPRRNRERNGGPKGIRKL